MEVKIVLSEIVADLDPSIRVDFANSVLSESPKFKNLSSMLWMQRIYATLDFAPSTREKNLSRMQKDNFSPSSLGYTHYFETMSKKTAYRNHIKNYELESKEFFIRKQKNTTQTLQTDLVTTLNDNPLKISTDISKHEEKHKPDVNPDPEPSS